jgi:hypothetical protein
MCPPVNNAFGNFVARASRPRLLESRRAGRRLRHEQVVLLGIVMVLAFSPATVHAATQIAEAPAWHPGSFGFIDREYSALGPFETTTLRVGESRIDVYINSSSTVDRAMILGWINKATAALASYYGHFPVKQLDLVLAETGRRGVHHGETFGGRLIRVEFGQGTSQRSFDSDWVLTHEMFHTAFPDLDESHIWMTEGMAVYLEPIARARVGNLTDEQVWRGVVRGMPSGLPEDGDQGLEYTHTWGRTYWGGTLFWMMADIRIREQTENRKSLDDAMRAILAAGGNGSTHWSIQRVITIADRATGTNVVRDLYDQMALKREETDLNALWKSLGISSQRWQTTFDNNAPMAGIRQAMTARR